MKKLERLCYFANYLSKKGLIIGSEGNLSIRDKKGFWITPSGKIKENLKPEEIAFINWNGEFLKGNPSSEWGMHLEIYRKNPAALAIVHSHPTYLLVLNLLGFPFKNFSLFEAQYFFKEIKIIPPLPPGSFELWNKVSEESINSNVLVLSNHGLVVWERDLETAVNLSIIFEKLCKIEYLKKLAEGFRDENKV
uniref:Class II aldolase/adducin family protein n=1 Tax=Thermodesulfobacterium geofontis TaxID=1295609 RepID=A0A7V4JRI8_9BACT